MNLLNNNEFFRSRELYQQIKDTVSTDIALFYKFRMAQFLNKKDSATIYLEKMITDYPGIFGAETIRAYATLFDIYAVDLRDYEKGKYTYERMIQYVSENPYHTDEKELTLWRKGNEGRLEVLKELVHRPPMEIKRRNAHGSVKIEWDKNPLSEAKLNGISQKVIFDTGSTIHLIMKKVVADRLGLKINEQIEGELNGRKTPAYLALVDSMEFGNITAYNIPVSIYDYDLTASDLPDSIRNDSNAIEDFYAKNDYLLYPVIGLPFLSQIGKFEIDNETKMMTFPNSDHHPDSSKEPNIFIYDDHLYTCLKLNGKDFTTYLDTGNDEFMAIDTSFYEKYANVIPIETTTDKEPLNVLMFHRAWTNVPYKTVHNPMITFNGKQIHPSGEENIKIYAIRSMWPAECFDGVTGYSLFKRIGKKVLLDLDHMRLEAIE